MPRITEQVRKLGDFSSRLQLHSPSGLSTKPPSSSILSSRWQTLILRNKQWSPNYYPRIPTNPPSTRLSTPFFRSASTMSETMNAVVFHGPFKIGVEKRPKPVLRDETDAIIKVTTAGLCGSELHMYRGHQKTKTGHIMGHEFVGVVESTGSSVKNFKPGDRIVSTFAAVCMGCWYCLHGYTNRCARSLAFGTQQLDGGQAEYVRVPLADGTMVPAPKDLPDSLLIMMCDIFPTGFYGASRAVEAFQTRQRPPKETSNRQVGKFDYESPTLEDAVFVCLGCGPVGLCAILTAKAKGVRTIYAVDSIDERLEEAEKMGGIPLKLGKDDIKETIMKATDGRGADAVVELVGNATALQSAFDLLRPCGYLSCIGFHHSPLPFTGLDVYTKNLNVNFGRAPVRTVFPEALETLSKHQDLFEGFVTHNLPLTDAPRGFEIFEKYQARKVVFNP